MRRTPDRVFRFRSEAAANQACQEMNLHPGVERAWVLRDHGLMVGPRIVRQAAWLVKLYVKPVLTSKPAQN